MALVKYTSSPAYKLRMYFDDNCRRRALKIAIVAVIIIAVAVIISIVVVQSGEDIDWPKIINEEIGNFTQMLDTFPNVTKFKRNLLSYEQPLSFYWGSDVYG